MVNDIYIYILYIYIYSRGPHRIRSGEYRVLCDLHYSGWRCEFPLQYFHRTQSTAAYSVYSIGDTDFREQSTDPEGSSSSSESGKELPPRRD